jgi:hypothetical protein
MLFSPGEGCDAWPDGDGELGLASRAGGASLLGGDWGLACWAELLADGDGELLSCCATAQAANSSKILVKSNAFRIFEKTSEESGDVAHMLGS